MEIPTQITYRNMEPSEAATARIESEAAKLDTFFGRIISCRVVVEAPHRHHRYGGHFRVRIEVGVPGTELVVSHEPLAQAALSREVESSLKKHLEIQPDHKDLYVSIRDAFASARRQLQDYAKRIRGDVKAHESDLRHGFATSGP